MAINNFFSFSIFLSDQIAIFVVVGLLMSEYHSHYKLIVLPEGNFDALDEGIFLMIYETSKRS